MTTSPSLINIPDLAVDIILKNVDFKTIFSLRKVCRPLRNYIDKRKPKVHINHIEFSMTPDLNITVKLKCNPKNEEEIREIVYSENPFVSFRRDFRIIMSHWKNQFLDVFKVDLECENPDNSVINQLFIDCIQSTFLKCPNNQRLYVMTLSLQVTNEHEIMRLLSFVDPNSLRILSLFTIGLLDLTEIRETDQFKSASLYISAQFEELESMAAFFNRSIVSVGLVHRIYWDQVLAILVSFRDHDDMQAFTISFLHFPDLQLFLDEFGEAIRDGDTSKWNASFVNKEIFIEVKLSMGFVPSLSFVRLLDLEEGEFLIFGDNDEEDEGEFDEEDEDEL
ncbi:hypothetical protein CAEBREN_11103 [Caenorhabditis brenneri]|uniref:F-box domain-containing protein n=1 Tax=Caenorhabditis brenneri TaxID=135651 RepID=G0NIB2_CAEBE|nr:hypothetical protein CAEBREN_11103 [Caenorhabditis brenneri]